MKEENGTRPFATLSTLSTQCRNWTHTTFATACHLVPYYDEECGQVQLTDTTAFLE